VLLGLKVFVSSNDGRGKHIAGSAMEETKNQSLNLLSSLEFDRIVRTFAILFARSTFQTVQAKHST